MAYASDQPKRIRVTLPSDPNYWVDVKTSLKYGEVKGYSEYGGEDGPFTIEEKLRRVVVEWNLDNEAGEILPVTAESIDLLQEADLVAIIEAFNAKEGSESAKKNSPKASSPSSAAQ